MTKRTLLLVPPCSGFIIALADDMPTFDMRATCGDESQGDPGAGASAAWPMSKVRDLLAVRWVAIHAHSKSICKRRPGISSIRSYVEHLTGLHMTKDVKALPKQ